MNSYSYNAGVQTTDEHGTRVGLNLIGGVCFDLPVVSPFAQVMVSVGDIDLVTIGGGFHVRLRRRQNQLGYVWQAPRS